MTNVSFPPKADIYGLGLLWTSLQTIGLVLALRSWGQEHEADPVHGVERRFGRGLGRHSRTHHRRSHACAPRRRSGAAADGHVYADRLDARVGPARKIRR